MAFATGETLIPANQSTVVITGAGTLEPMALRLAYSSLYFHHHFIPRSQDYHQQHEEPKRLPFHLHIY